MEDKLVQSENQPRQTGAELLLSCLEQQGVERIFGYPGGAVLPVFDALYEERIANILMCHEQGSVHAAEGYAKATGKPGVVLVTSGPGATNVVTGIADAMSDSVPLVVITGQVATPGIGKDAFQEADVLGITLPIVKNSYQVRSLPDLPQIVSEAFEIATTGRKGPVVIDLPKDLTSIATTVQPTDVLTKKYQVPMTPSNLAIQRLMGWLKQAQKPVLLIGAGVISAQATAELRELVNRYQIPTVSTLLGLGSLPSHHPDFLGMGGMHGTYTANMALMEADLLINIGSRFDDRLACSASEFAPHAKIVHIDIDAAEIGKVIPTDLAIVGDARLALAQMLAYPVFAPPWEAWREVCRTRQQEYPLRYESSPTVIKPQAVIEQVGKLTAGKAYVVTDVGQHQMWVAQYYPFTFPQQLITSGGLGTMGYGIPAGIGVKIAQPKAQVVVFVGDGGFQMTSQELAVLRQNNLDIKFVLMNNQSLGMVRQWQERFFNERRSNSVGQMQPDFMKLAQAYGIFGCKLTDPKTLATDLTKALSTKGPALIEVLICNQEHVLPMIPAGKANDQMIGVSK